jgi:dTMP kinase
MTAQAGFFVVFEGGDGAGKSTQISLLADHLRTLGRRVVVTHEPGGSRIGKQVRALLLDGDDLDPRAEALLFAADRADHVASVIAPALREGAVVISDRYIDSSIAYQGAGRGLGTAEVGELSQFAVNGTVPDLTVLLDVEPITGRARAAKHGPADRIEREPDKLHARVRQAFLDLASANPQRYLVLDAEEPAEALAQRIRSEVEAAL